MAIKPVYLSAFCILFYGCNRWNNTVSDQDLRFESAIAVCGSERTYSNYSKPKLNIPNHPRLLGDRAESPWPLIQANDCRQSGGVFKNGVLDISLEISLGDFRPETNDRPGVLVASIGEAGKAPSIPGPMIRVEEGTMIRVRLVNQLMDSSATFHGLYTRTNKKADSIFLKPGESKTIEFLAGAPGNYMYKVVLGNGITWELGEEEQLSGAIIIDPKGYNEEDRVIVMNIFRAQIDTALWKHGWLETLVMNGKSWPYTELLRPGFGTKTRWKIINANQRFHPMHLHGFYFDVVGEGNEYAYNQTETGKREHIVTKNMLPFTTMEMEWTPSRPGRWLFHCHFPFHVINDIRLPESAKLDDPDSHAFHMAGLVMGIDIADGESDLIQKGPPREISLIASETDTLEGFGMRFSKDDSHPKRPGPILVLRQYQPTFVTVENRMSQSTAVHWHGLELDAWADGVPGWSHSDNKTSPEIAPGGKFTYQLSLMRPGTFIYHSHHNDLHQLKEGLYGAIIVLPEGKEFVQEVDHVYIVGQKKIDDPLSPEQIDVNGVLDQPTIETHIGSDHRLRLINIGLLEVAQLEMTKNGEPYPIKFIAKDGADLAMGQQTMVIRSAEYSVGETADFQFIPNEPGEYKLKITFYKQTVEQLWQVK